MDFPDYFYPVDFAVFRGEGQIVNKTSLGKYIEDVTGKLNYYRPSELDVAIIGVPYDNGNISGGSALSPDKIRSYLYNLAPFGKKLTICDLGNLKPATTKKGTFLGLRDIIEYLNEEKIFTVVIGGSQDLTSGICEALKSNKFLTLSVADAVADIKKGIETYNSSNYLTDIFKKLPGLFQFNLIGYQNHLVGEKYLSKIEKYGESLRLGQLRDDFTQTETILRNSDILSLDMSVINYSFAPASGLKNPNGLRGEEVCRLARFAGLSNRMKVFGLFELFPEDDTDDITIKLAAEIIWYLLDGITHRPVNEQKVWYKVAIDGLDKPLIFCQDTETNRWWFEISSLEGEKINIACSEKEYRQAANNEIPVRWIKFMQKIDAFSK